MFSSPALSICVLVFGFCTGPLTVRADGLECQCSRRLLNNQDMARFKFH